MSVVAFNGRTARVRTAFACIPLQVTFPVLKINCPSTQLNSVNFEISIAVTIPSFANTGHMLKENH